jgi:hypothetical protein
MLGQFGQPRRGSSFWSRVPTDREFIAQALTSYIHGATGVLLVISRVP